ncbi:MAG: acyl-CoA carboxylase subunit beta, partial [Chitinophagaceae bacterium]
MNKQELEYNQNEDSMQLEVSHVKQYLTKIALGGGRKNIDKIKQKGKLTSRERIKYLIDDKTVFHEIGAFAGFD